MALVGTAGKLGLLGSGGLLGSAMLAEFGEENVVQLDWRLFLAGSKSDLRAAIRSAQVQTVINCAAHTNVEAAEDDPENDRQSNAILPAKLAEACAATQIRLVQFSSTGCYGDWQRTPYVETDSCHPTTKHHQHKLDGETAVLGAGCEHLILRTGWLFGASRENQRDFVKSRIDDAKKSRELISDSTQFGNPTFTRDVARQTHMLLDAGAEGIFNLVNTEPVSRFTYVKKIIELSGLPCHVIAGGAFRRKAKVSSNEMAKNAKLNAMGLSEPTSWIDALERYLIDLRR